jgi:hypothetical protein
VDTFAGWRAAVSVRCGVHDKSKGGIGAMGMQPMFWSLSSQWALPIFQLLISGLLLSCFSTLHLQIPRPVEVQLLGTRLSQFSKEVLDSLVTSLSCKNGVQISDIQLVSALKHCQYRTHLMSIIGTSPW